MNLLYSINASFTVVRIFKLCYDDRIRREKQNKRRGDRMDLLIKIGIFAVAALVLNYVVNIIYKYILKKTGAIHLQFSKSVLVIVIDVIVIYSLAQQFDMTKEISKVVLQSGSLILAIATFAAQHALGNVISGVSISVSKPYNEGEKIRVVQGGTVIAEIGRAHV